ncbi:MAG TPA: hypothetical protein VHQ24_07295, partial [Lachnospiraceae bacterium]|nr:hypothetical protein [Lachnospiraceae bacterium]
MKTIRIRKYIFNFRILVLLLFLLYNLTACGAQDRVSQNETKNDAAMNIEEGDYKDEVVKGLPSITPKVSDEKSSVQDGDVTLKKEATIDRETLVNVYKSVLKGVFEDHIFPA